MQKILKSMYLVLLILVGCSSNSTGPEKQELTAAQVAGQYSSSIFTKGAVDILAAGGSLNLTLKADNTTTGRLFIPDTLGLTEGGDFEADLQGAFTITGTEITFQHQADTFVRDLTWTFDNGKLNASQIFGGEKLVLTLQRGN